MAETFLILLAGGILLAAALSDPRQVRLAWLRLGGVLALSLTGVGLFFLLRRDVSTGRLDWGLMVVLFLATVLQLVFAQAGALLPQRLCAGAGCILAIAEAVRIIPTATSGPLWPIALTAMGAAAMLGLSLMDMLLGHAYLTAGQMSTAPFLRLNRSLAIATVLRLLCSAPLALWLQSRHPVYMLWGQHGLYMLTRWGVGLVLPAVFIYMAHDCIRRRSTQSATGILYVAGVLIFIGELVALNLASETGLPF